MAQKTARVTARVPEELVRRLENVMELENIDSVSQCLRACIEAYLDLKTTLPSTQKISLELGEDILDDINHLVDIGRINNLEDACRSAIINWTEEQVNRYILNRDRYDRLIIRTKERILEDRAQRKLISYYKSP
jgi:Arc/MetJ-type ribon-helix-helix transcriptional regulator